MKIFIDRERTVDNKVKRKAEHHLTTTQKVNKHSTEVHAKKRQYILLIADSFDKNLSISSTRIL